MKMGKPVSTIQEPTRRKSWLVPVKKFDKFIIGKKNLNKKRYIF